MPTMGLGFGLEKSGLCIKQTNRWLFKIPEISAQGINSLPPAESARPSVSVREITVEHINETINFPGRIEFKPINLVLYDLKKNKHPVFGWFKRFYDPCSGTMNTPVDNNFILTGVLELYNGCGDTMETWIYENIYPNNIDWGELNMADSAVLKCNLTLRYTRAYLVNKC